MNKNELNESLKFVVDNADSLEIIFYAILKGAGGVKKLDIKAEDLAELKVLFSNGISSSILDVDYQVLPLSTADERKNCLYEYDLDLPEELTVLEDVIGDDSIGSFRFNESSIDSIDSLVIVIAYQENSVVLYKHLSAVEVIGRGGYIFGKSNQRFERFKDELLRITPKYQVLKVEDNIIIIDLQSIERSLGFHDVIKREAISCLSAIKDMDIVVDIEGMSSLIDDDVSFARIITRSTKESPVIKLNIANSAILAFAKTHPATKKMKYSADGSKFDLKTKISKKLFLKLLNDDLLTSELTKLHYASLAKDNIDSEEVVVD